MATLVWHGEPEGDNDGPRKNTWNGYTFPRGEEVEVDNEHMIKKARRMPSFSVDGKTYVPNGEEEHPSAKGGKSGPLRREKTEYSEMTVAELRQLADERGVDVDGLKKAEIVEKLMESPETENA